MSTRGPAGEGGVKERVERKEKLDKPPLYKVVLHNDDFTTMEFVIEVLEGVFHKSKAEATVIMLAVHHQGQGVAGVYPREIAETKASKVTALAQAQEYPLLVTVEPEPSAD